jgi:tRNA (cmo5U34)-methyltransferase
MPRSDNATPHHASEYDKNIRKNIPYYDSLHEAVICLVSAYEVNPVLWIDTGCGTGTFVERAYDLFPKTKFILADPSPAMLKIAAEKLSGRERVTILEPVDTGNLIANDEAVVITAIQSLHYQKSDERAASIRNCHRLLKPGGVFISFENIRPLTKLGIAIGKETWKQYEMRAGKSPEEAQKHLDRFDVEYHPLTIEEHLELLRGCNFSTVEVLWYSYMQAGFYAVK